MSRGKNRFEKFEKLWILNPNNASIIIPNRPFYYFQMEPCIWHQCIDPILPENKGLKYLWDGKPVEFGDSVTYKCARSNLFFEYDRELESFDIECLNDGSFDVPDDDEWLNCVSSKLTFLYYRFLNVNRIILA